jgi:hypothetical protein
MLNPNENMIFVGEKVMKALFTVPLLLAATAAQALECTDIARIDDGYAISISDADDSASIYKVSKKSRTLIATVACTDPGFKKPDSADQIYTSLICGDINSLNEGYDVFVQTGGLAGNTTAILSEKSAYGSAKIATLSCGQ